MVSRALPSGGNPRPEGRGIVELKSLQNRWKLLSNVLYSALKHKIKYIMLPQIKTIFKRLHQREKLFFFLLTIVAGIFILWPLHDFQHYLAQGDHGRDLYCFKKTLHGAIPYRDYSWLFGPLMPYYYSLAYILGGISIQSVLLAQGFLILLTGVFIYRTCAVFLSPATAFVCSIWYWCFRGTEFFYTYNHSGGLLVLIAALYYLFNYIKTNRIPNVYTGFICLLLLTLIRPNMGIAILIAFVASLLLTDFIYKSPKIKQNRKIYLLCTAILLIISSLIYWFLLHPLPDYAITQSFPYGKSQRTDYSASPFSAFVYLLGMLVTYFKANITQTIFGALLFLSIVQLFLKIISNKILRQTKIEFLLIFCSLGSFIVLGSHEFIASGVFYRFFWIFPIIFITIFHLIAIAIRDIRSPVIKIITLLALFLPSMWNIQRDHRIIQSFKKPYHQLSIGENKIHTSQHPYWFKTVTDATNFIKTNIPPSERILVLPLDPLYLFLGERDSASRQLVFFEHINITSEQEKEIIKGMENNNGNWAIISNRSVSPEEGMGIFGKTYCPILGEYLDTHFILVAQFGDWKNQPGWAWNHGVRIFRRIN